MRHKIGRPMVALMRPQWAKVVGMARIPVPRLPLIMCIKLCAKFVLSVILSKSIITFKAVDFNKKALISLGQLLFIESYFDNEGGGNAG